MVSLMLKFYRRLDEIVFGADGAHWAQHPYIKIPHLTKGCFIVLVIRQDNTQTTDNPTEVWRIAGSLGEIQKITGVLIFEELQVTVE